MPFLDSLHLLLFSSIGALLQKFMHDISVEYSNYLSGERISSDFPDSCCGRDLGPGQRDASGFQPLRIVYRWDTKERFARNP